MKTFFLSFLLLLGGFWSWGQCPTGDIVLTTQGQVDSFGINYPGCTEVLGGVTIGANSGTTNINNLLALNQINSIAGDLLITKNTNLLDLQGLQTVTNIGGSLIIKYNYNIQSLNGLQNITAINGSLEVVSENDLTSISSFDNLNSVGGRIFINSNSSLPNLDGLETVNFVGGDISITTNGLDSLYGFPPIDSIFGELTIQNNSSLQNIKALSNLKYVTGSCRIGSISFGFTSLAGLESLSVVGGQFNISNIYDIVNLDELVSLSSVGSFWVSSCSNLTNIDYLPSLTNITNELHLSSNYQLLSITGFSAITNLAEGLTLHTNEKLNTLNGLNSITTILGYVNIQQNHELTNLEGLGSLEEIGYFLKIISNNKLASLTGLQSLKVVGTSNFSGSEIRITSNNLLTNLVGLSSLDSIYGQLVVTYNNTLLNLTGLENLSYVNGMGIASNPILTSLYGLDGLSDINGDIRVQDNPLLTNFLGLSEINTILGSLSILGNPILTDLSGLESLSYISNDLDIRNCQLLANFNELGALQAIGEDLAIIGNSLITGLHGFQSLSTINGDLTVSYNPSLINLEGLEALTTIGGFSCEINIALESLNGLESLISVLGFVEIADNPQLSDCTVIAFCNKLVTSPSQVTIEENALGCNSKLEVQQSCSYLSNSTGSVYFDINCNGLLDEFDVISPQAILKKAGSNIPIASTNNAGAYKATFYQSTTNEYVVSSPDGYSPQPASHTIVTNSVSQQFPNKDFHLCPDSLFHNLKTTLISVTVPRPGFTNQYQICVQNLGTQPENATLTLDFSTGIGAQYITITDAAGGTVQNNIITWNITDLQLFDNECFSVTIQLATNTPLGIYLQPTANVSLTPAQTETILSDNLVALNDQVVGSYDPNDKTVDMPNITYDPTSGVTRLQYKIRFQNTGTFLATFIEVLDTLESKLDIRTIEMVAASHDYTLSFPSPNVLKWRFDDINLPDSTSNEPGSHGFIVFNISTKTPINLGEMVQNRAGIYFDFNEPIITNYATTSFTVGTFDPFGLGSLPLSIAPNPTQDNITIRYSLTESADSELLITNAQGVVVQSQRLGKQGVGDYALPVDLVGLPSGLYLVTVRVGGLVGVGKVVRL